MIYEIDEKNITMLNDYQLTDLLRRLLLLETKNNKMDVDKIDIGLSITTRDGGVDGLSKLKNQKILTEYIPSDYSVWQCKATDITSTKAGDEVENKNKNCIKPYLDKCLIGGADYILFTTTSLNSEQKHACVNSIRNKFKYYKCSYTDSVLIKIFDSSTIKSWVNNYINAVIYVKSEIGLSSPYNIETYKQWTSIIKRKVEFKSDLALDNFILELTKRLVKPGEVTRLLGLSGLGKTRLVHEVITRNDYDNIKERLVFYDAANGRNDFISLLRHYSSKENILFVVDNCDSESHSYFSEIVQDTRSTLITIDSDTNIISHKDTILCPKMSDEVIKLIIKDIHPDINDRYLERITDFANGFPKIAVMINQQIVEEQDDIGNLDDDILMRKLLGKHNDEEWRCLQTCALFKHFRVDGTEKCHTKFLANNIANTDYSSFFRIIKKYEKRGIFERRGDFLKLVPRPLSVRLAAEWWETTPNEIIIKIVNSLNPDKSPKGLSDAFCEAVTTLSFLKRTQELTKELCGTQGPFGHAEMLETEWGSKLFRAFVEIDPITTTNTLYSHISKMSDEELLYKYDYNIRRNYVWALEKLCFWKSTFKEATEILLRFAISENEHWANNATGQLGHLFQVYLSGTEATPEMRIDFLNKMSLKYKKGNSILLRSVIHCFEIEHLVGSYGPTEQGSKINLEEWRPKLWSDIFEYWDSIIKYICQLLKSYPELYDPDINLESSIIPILKYKRFESVEYFVTLVIESDFINKDSLRNSLNHAIKWYSKDFSDIEIDKIEMWLKKLSPKNFIEEFRLFIDDPGYEYIEDENSGKYIDITLENANKFISKCMDDDSWYDKIGTFIVTGKLQLGFIFGREILLSIDEPDKFIDILFKNIKLQKIDLNLCVLSGALFALKKISIEAYNDYCLMSYNNEYIKPYFIHLIKSIEPSVSTVQKSFSLIRDNIIEISALRDFSFGQPLHHLTESELLTICEEIFSFSEEGIWICLSILYMNYYRENNESSKLIDFYCKAIRRLSFKKGHKIYSMDSHYWKEIMLLLLKVKSDEAVEIALSCIYKILTNEETIISVQSDSVYELFAKIIKDNFSRLVEDFIIKIITSKDYLAIWHFELLLNQKLNNDIPIINLFSNDELIKMMKKNQDVAIFFAKTVNIYVENNEETDNQSAAESIVNNFSDVDILESLSLIGGIQSSWGSRAGIIKTEISFYKMFMNDERSVVQLWAKKMIKIKEKELSFENKKIEERQWGIY